MIAASRDAEARFNPHPHPPPINCPAFSGVSNQCWGWMERFDRRGYRRTQWDLSIVNQKNMHNPIIVEAWGSFWRHSSSKARTRFAQY